MVLLLTSQVLTSPQALGNFINTMKIKTDFKKFKETEPPSRWARLYHAGTDWFMLWESLEEQVHSDNGRPFFYVRP